jgi:ferredoxin
VCPVSCIHTTAEAPQYYIDPEVCIACEQCVLVCPVKAIYLDEEVPPDQTRFIQINADFFQQNKPPATPVTYAEGRAMSDAAQSFAAARNLKIAVAVVGPDGEPIVVDSMPGTEAGVTALAVEKAYCAARLQAPTHELPRQLPASATPGGRLGTITIPDDFDFARYTPGMGGFPIAQDISVLGAIGVAGAGSGDLDMLCCQTAVSLFMVLR